MSGKKSNHQQQSSSTKSQELVNDTKKKKNHHLFSGKQKKVQLKEERLKKANKHKNEEIIKSNDPYRSSGSSCRGDLNYIEGYENHEKDNNTRIYQSSYTMLTDSIPLCHKSTTEHKHTVLYHHNRHHMNFDQVIDERRALGKQLIIKLPIDSQSEYINDESRLHCPILTIPIRPLGYEGLTKEQLIQREDIYFQHYLKELLETYAFDNLSKNNNNCNDDDNYDTNIKYELNNFELNLNVWRQLWRVIERSDIILILADARYPQYTIPLGLINYLQMMIKKPCIIILTKIDLVPNDYITSWLEWYHRYYPSFKVIPYSSHPSDEMLSRVTAELKVDDVQYRDGEDDVDSGDDNNHNDESDSDNDNADESDESMNEHDDIHSNSFIRNKHMSPITINISDVEPTHRLAMKRGKTRQLVGRRWIAPYGADELLVLIKKELLIHHTQHDDDVNSNRCDERDDSDGNSCNVAGNSHDSMMEERINRISFLPSHILPTLKPSRHRSDDKAIDNCDDIRDNDDDDDDNQDDDDDDNENERTNVIDPKSYNKINPNKINSNEGIRFKQKKQSKFKYSSYYSHKQGHTTKDNHVKILPQVANQVPQYITIGVLGCPNAGKSSFINSLSRKKVVSASKTPGHTKHLQTIFLNEYTRLCDCPGLIFPTLNVPYQMQIICGEINIAQVRETFTTLAFIAARFPLAETYHLHHPSIHDGNDDDYSTAAYVVGSNTYRDTSNIISNNNNNYNSNDNNIKTDRIKSSSSSSSSSSISSSSSSSSSISSYTWSGYNIAEAYARKKGYYTKKLRLDVHRAGNEILRDIQSGKVVFAMSPPITI